MHQQGGAGHFDAEHARSERESRGHFRAQARFRVARIVAGCYLKRWREHRSVQERDPPRSFQPETQRFTSASNALVPSVFVEVVRTNVRQAVNGQRERRVPPSSAYTPGCRRVGSSGFRRNETALLP